MNVRSAQSEARASELECEHTIIAACRVLGYRVHGERAAFSPGRRRFSTPIKGDAGWPDLIICGHGHVLAVELKRHPNRIEPEQAQWLHELRRAGVSAEVVWVPEGLQSFLNLLGELAGKRVRP